jgi:cell division protein FtsL
MATSAIAGQQIEMMGATARPHRRTQSVAERNRSLLEAQRKARRGPTPEVFFTKHIDNTRLVKADDPERRREMRQFTVAMSMLFVLVMVYVWQHFMAIEIGYRVEAQRQQVEQLREQNHQLRLSEAQLTDPERIDKLAKQLGLDAPQPGQVIRPDGSDVSAGGPVWAEAKAPAIVAR